MIMKKTYTDVQLIQFAKRVLQGMEANEVDFQDSEIPALDNLMAFCGHIAAAYLHLED